MNSTVVAVLSVCSESARKQWSHLEMVGNSSRDSECSSEKFTDPLQTESSLRMAATERSARHGLRIIKNRNSNLQDCKRPTAEWKWRLSDRHFPNCSSISSQATERNPAESARRVERLTQLCRVCIGFPTGFRSVQCIACNPRGLHVCAVLAFRTVASRRCRRL